MLFSEVPHPHVLDIPQAERRAPGVSDLLDYERPAGTVCLRHKSGGLIAAFNFKGPSHEALEGAALDASEAQLVHALSELGTGFVVHFDLARFRTVAYPCVSSATDRASRVIEDARRVTFETTASFKSQTTLWITSFFEKENDEASEEAFVRALETFLSKVDQDTQLHRLNVESMVSRLHAALRVGEPTPLSVHPDAFLDTLIAPSLERLPSGVLRMARHFAVPLRFTGPPQRLRSGVMTPIATAQIPFRLATRFVMLSPSEAHQAINLVRRRRETAQFSWKALIRTITRGKDGARSERDRDVDRGLAPDDSVQSRKIREANQALEVHHDGGRFVYFTTTLLVAGLTEQEAKQNAAKALTTIRAARLNAEPDDFNEIQAYLGAAPGNAWSNIRRSLQPLPAALALQPLTSTWSGNDDAPHPRLRGQGPLAIVRSADGESFRLNLHPEGDALSDLGHTLIIGPTGSGKSVLLNFLAASARRYRDSQVISLDVDRSQMVHCLAADGAFYDLGDEDAGFAPLFQLRERTFQARSAALTWLMSLWEATHPGEPLGDDDAEHLADAVEEVLRLDPELHSLEILATKVQSQTLRKLFGRFTGRGEYARLFAGRTNRITAKPYTVIELRDVLAMRAEARTPALQHLLQLIATMLDGRPSWVLIDEGSHVLSDPVLAKGIRDWLITARKRSTAVIFATQSLKHLADPALRQIMNESCPTRIFLPNREAGTNEGIRTSYREAGLTDRQIDRIAEATPKRHYLLMQRDEERLIDLALSPTELAILGVSEPNDLARVRALRKQHEDDWLERWVAQRLQSDPI